MAIGSGRRATVRHSPHGSMLAATVHRHRPLRPHLQPSHHARASAAEHVLVRSAQAAGIRHQQHHHYRLQHRPPQVKPMGGHKLTPKDRTLRLWLKSETNPKGRPWTWKQAATHYYRLTGTRPSQAQLFQWRGEYLAGLIAAQPPTGTAERAPAEAVKAIPAASEFPVEIVPAASHARVLDPPKQLPVWEDPNAMAVSASKAGLGGLSKTIGAFEQDDYVKANAAGSIG